MKMNESAEQKPRHRKKGRGHIRETRKGVYKVVAYRGRHAVSGKPMYLTATSKGDRKKAEVALTELLRRIDLKEAVDPDKMTVGVYLDSYNNAVVKPTLALNTDALYRRITARLKPLLGHVAVQRLTTGQVDRALSQLLGEGLATTTVRLYLAYLNGALKQAVADGLLLKNPTTTARRPKLEKRTVECWTAADAKQFLSAVKATGSPMLSAFFDVALETGARQGELLALRWSDIDVRTNTINIERQMLRPPKKNADGRYTPAVYGSPKGSVRAAKRGSGKRSAKARTVKVGAATMRTLEAHRREQKKLLLANMAFRQRFERGDDDAKDLVFSRGHEQMTAWEPDALGLPLRNHTVREAFTRLAKAAGLPVLPLHSTRHTNATALIAAGMPIADVSRRLGHSSIATTLSVYTHPQSEHEDEGVARWSALLHG